MMDVAVPANMHVGLHQEEIAKQGLGADRRARRSRLLGQPDVALVDLRERSEREKHGTIPGSLHAPYPDLQREHAARRHAARARRRDRPRVVFYCAFGERSAMAVQAAQDAGLASACHIQGGIDAWRKAGGAAGAALKHDPEKWLPVSEQRGRAGWRLDEKSSRSGAAGGYHCAACLLVWPAP